ncbi:peptidyl-prolyl cis-trans isomerase [Namhaeicola litoreus]|uniref:Peptidyl-prolyl cis-trans isomerase n=1 Tax=Namhaeicola litoreus TaxID=1052145 RepID=A0ABW3Y3M2_9FLAO
MKKLLKEPLVHFIFIGIFLFILYGLVNKNEKGGEVIRLDQSDVDNIIASWEMQWKRLPTEDELKNLLEQNIKQEIFYQEALKMNLDHNDEIIKRRLSQKMQFISNDIAALKKPTDQDLQDYFEANSEKYAFPPTFTFYQIIFSRDNRKDPKSDAIVVLKNHSNASFDEMKNFGDKMPFPYSLTDINQDEIAYQFGSTLSESFENIPLNQWYGPVSSSFGEHLVFIANKIEKRIPKLEEVKRDVLLDYEYNEQQKTNEAIMKELKKKYRVELDFDPEKFEPEFVKEMENQINS